MRAYGLRWLFDDCALPAAAASAAGAAALAV
jgi:hypothetical protein